MSTTKMVSPFPDKTFITLQEKVNQEIDLEKLHSYLKRKEGVEVHVFRDEIWPTELALSLKSLGLESVKGQLLSVRSNEGVITAVLKNVTVRHSNSDTLLKAVQFIWDKFPGPRPKVHFLKDRVSFVWDERPFFKK